MGGEGVLDDAIFKFDRQFRKRTRFLCLHRSNRAYAHRNGSYVVFIANGAKEEEPGIEARAGE